MKKFNKKLHKTHNKSAAPNQEQIEYELLQNVSPRNGPKEIYDDDKKRKHIEARALYDKKGVLANDVTRMTSRGQILKEGQTEFDMLFGDNKTKPVSVFQDLKAPSSTKVNQV